MGQEYRHRRVLVLFALNRRWLLSEKTALAEIAGFTEAPRAFAERTRALLGKIGETPEELASAVAAEAELVAEIRALAGSLYRRPF